MNLSYSYRFLAVLLSVLGQAQAQISAVYAMGNEVDGNMIVAYEAQTDGSLTLIGEYPTGGNGAILAPLPGGLDPLIAAYALTPTLDSCFLLAVNAGNETLSVLKIDTDGSLMLVDQQPTLGTGPNSIATSGTIVYVSNTDADGVFESNFNEEGSLVGYRLTEGGILCPIEDSSRLLNNRPGAIRFSPDGKYLLVVSYNAGASALPLAGTDGFGNDEIVVYAVGSDGRLGESPVASASSTFPNNAEGRNLPTAIGFEITVKDDVTFVVVSESRQILPDGSPPTFAGLQVGGASSWKLETDGSLTPVSLDVKTEATDGTDVQRTGCWLRFNADSSGFWVSNAIDASLSSFSLADDGTIALVEVVAAQGSPFGNPTGAPPSGFVDFWLSADGLFLYQLYGLAGTIGVFSVTDEVGLAAVTEVTGDLPRVASAGIVALDVSTSTSADSQQTCEAFSVTEAPTSAPTSSASAMSAFGALAATLMVLLL